MPPNNHVCEECGQGFRMKSYLSKHRKVHHLEIYPFTCSFCAKLFSREDKLLLHEVQLCSFVVVYSCGKKDSTKRYLRNKTILTTCSISRPGVDPPPRKIITFFLKSLALSVPTSRHFQSNGVNCRSSKYLTKKYIMIYYIKNSFDVWDVWYFASCLYLIGNVYKLAH